jgi:3-hydroxyisobutyrate dehydrogenase-like beta-hydroxyacid dehydrogenase
MKADSKEYSMAITIAITAPGNMGSGVGALLARNGAKVLTSLQGRSTSSAARAQAAGMISVGDEELVAADFLLSILPPKEALPIAERLAPALRSAPRKPVYIDCNAVSPETVLAIERIVKDTGTPFLDGSIIGPPPKAEGANTGAATTFYLSGNVKDAVSRLASAGLDVKALDAPVGAASALKMSYGGITKGLAALGSVMGLAADRYGVGQVLSNELAASQPQLFAWLGRTVPGMFPKAYRWVAEMDEISAYLGERPESGVYSGIARAYEHFAADWAGEQSDAEALARMLRGNV